MANSKAKGSGFERDVAKFLTGWCGGDPKVCDWVWRTPSSGGKATILTSNTTMTGDLIPLHPDAVFFFNVFSVECKTGYGHDGMEQLLKDVKNKKILSFWEQATRDAELGGRYPLLIYKNGPIKWCATDNKFLNDYPEPLNIKSLRYNNESETIYFFNYDEFFQTITKENIIKLGENVC